MVKVSGINLFKTTGLRLLIVPTHCTELLHEVHDVIFNAFVSHVEVVHVVLKEVGVVLLILVLLAHHLNSRN